MPPACSSARAPEGNAEAAPALESRCRPQWYQEDSARALSLFRQGCEKERWKAAHILAFSIARVRV